MTRELAAMRARASARKDPDPVSVRVDPAGPHGVTVRHPRHLDSRA